ncbi:MAG: polysaccharide export protein [Deltaproteobacteria bacterium]|nr:polysaccharide export protein [Deltaproteobacteria bacterium]
MKSKMVILSAFFALTILLVSCAPNSVMNPVSISQMNQQSQAYPQKEYIIAPGDILDIKFLNNPELNEIGVTVRPDGRISLQLAPEIKAAGLAPNQLREQLNQKYSADVKKPDVNIVVRSFSDQKIFVDGEVVLPGLVELKGPTTVMRAISQARGLRETARISNVIVIRKDFEGNPMATNINLAKVINGTDMAQDIHLMPYDIVYVPKSNIARVNKFVDEYINRVVPGGFPGWQTFANPYRYSFGGFTKIYPDNGVTTVVVP